MHPPLSIIFFTVLSGIGLGLTVILALSAFALPAAVITTATATAFVLVTGGLCASVAHLANPKNAWRAFMRVRTSWLSREAVAAVLYFIILFLWWWFSAPLILTVLLITVAAFTVICTAMIYQSLKPIAHWHHPSTSYNYINFAFLSGCAWFQQVLNFSELPAESSVPHILKNIIILMVLITYIGKHLYYRRIDSLNDTTTGNAIGHSQAQARLLDAGHTGPTFLTREFIADKSKHRHKTLRRLSLSLWILGGITAAPVFIPPLITAAGAVIMTAGILLERWLFFAEARHTIRAYH